MSKPKWTDTIGINDVERMANISRDGKLSLLSLRREQLIESVRKLSARLDSTPARVVGNTGQASPGVTADGALLAAGGDPASLAARPSVQSERESLLRELRASREAATLLDGQIRQMHCELSQKFMLNPVVIVARRDAISAKLQCYRQLLAAITACRRLRAAISSKGIDNRNEPLPPVLTDFDEALVGGIGGFPSLAWTVENLEATLKHAENAGE